MREAGGDAGASTETLRTSHDEAPRRLGTPTRVRNAIARRRLALQLRQALSAPQSTGRGGELSHPIAAWQDRRPLGEVIPPSASLLGQRHASSFWPRVSGLEPGGHQVRSAPSDLQAAAAHQVAKNKLREIADSHVDGG